MIVWFAEWLSKPRHWVFWLMTANFMAWAVFGLSAIGLWAVFK